MLESFTIRTGSRVEFRDITEKVKTIISASGLKGGTCTVFVPHTTAAVTINESADPDVVRDIIRELEKIVPMEDEYAHLEGNSAAHIKSSLVGASETILIDGGDPLLGTWQGIFFCDFDGPRKRKVYVKLSY